MAMSNMTYLGKLIFTTVIYDFPSIKVSGYYYSDNVVSYSPFIQEFAKTLVEFDGTIGKEEPGSYSTWSGVYKETSDITYNPDSNKPPETRSRQGHFYANRP